jgi:hypothetical protein
MLLVSLIATLAVAQPAAAQPAASLQPVGPGSAIATLATPRVLTQVFDGRSWTCDDAGRCVGRGDGANQPAIRECRRFVARLGPVTAYGRSGQALTVAELAQCNTAAAN